MHIHGDMDDAEEYYHKKKYNIYPCDEVKDKAESIYNSDNEKKSTSRKEALQLQDKKNYLKKDKNFY